MDGGERGHYLTARRVMVIYGCSSVIINSAKDRPLERRRRAGRLQSYGPTEGEAREVIGNGDNRPTCPVSCFSINIKCRRPSCLCVQRPIRSANRLHAYCCGRIISCCSVWFDSQVGLLILITALPVPSNRAAATSEADLTGLAFTVTM